MNSNRVDATPLKKRRKVPVFWITMLVLIAVNAFAIHYVLGRLRVSLTEYESGTPETSLRSYLAQIDRNEFGDIAADSGFIASPLNSAADYENYIRGIFGGLSGREDVDFRKTAAKTDDASWEQYMIFCGGQEIAPLWLAPAPEESGRKWLIRADIVYKPGYSVIAPQHLKVSVSGHTLSDENATLERAPIRLFNILEDEQARPSRIRYTTGETLYEQEVTVTAPGEGSGCVLRQEVGQLNPRRLEAWEELPGQTLELYASLVEDAAKLYAAYVTNDAQFDDLKPFLIPGTTLYEGVRTLDRQWYVEHDSYGFEDLRIDNITAWSQEHFSGDISFTYNVIKGGRAYPYPSSYQMAFIKADGEWKLLHLQVR